MQTTGEEKIFFLDTGFTNYTHEELLLAVERHIRSREKASLIFLNVDVVMKAEKSPYLKKIIAETEYLLADGMPLIWISKLFKRPLKEKVSGSDFVPFLCERAAKEGYSLFFLGGQGGATERACERLKQTYPGIRIAGSNSPPLGFENSRQEIEKIIAAIRRAGPDILVVSFGCPKQEIFTYENRESYDVPVSICTGATIDFLSGDKKRCPKWMSQSGLEWFYRFLQEPRRLFKRYFIDDVQILGLILKYWKR